MSMLMSYNGMVVKKRRITSVWLEINHTSGIEMFNCPTCKTPICQIQADMVTIIPGDSPSKLPIIVQCPNRNGCGRKYQFHVVTETEET